MAVEHLAHVVALLGDGQRIARERVLLDLCDVAVHAVGQREDRRDADDANRARESRHGRAALLGHEVSRREAERREEAHGGAARGLGIAARGRGGVEGVRVISDAAVGERDDARGVAVGELGVVRDHDDEAVLRDLLEQVHDLHRRRRVKGARWLVGEHDLGVVYEGARDGDALHLAAGELRGAFVNVLCQAHAPEGLHGAATALGVANPREREGELDVLEDRLVRDEVVALEDEADAVVAVGVPVAVVEILGRDAVDQKVARVEVVEAADDIEHGRLARARGAQDGDELVVAKRQAHVVERDLGEGLRNVLLADVSELEHAVGRLS